VSVHNRMLEILGALPAIGKDQRNPQQGFMFRGHDDILNALNPLLSQFGVFVVPDVLERVTAQRETSKGGVMYEVNLHVRFTFYGAEGDSVVASTWGEGTDMGDKATNKAMTMAFKNVLNQTFAISSAEFKDADAETPEPTQGRNRQASPERDRERGALDAATRGGQTPPVSRSEGAPPPATEKPAGSGQYAQIKTTLKLLDETFPEHPGDGRTWADVAREHAGKSADRLSMAEANALNDWLEDQYRVAQQEMEVPFG
jgi:ERF superfamily